MKAYKNTSDQNQNPTNFKQGQELIWDSGSGYDVVTFKTRSKLFNGSWSDCQLKTGESRGKVIPLDSTQLREFF